MARRLPYSTPMRCADADRFGEGASPAHQNRQWIDTTPVDVLDNSAPRDYWITIFPVLALGG